MNLQQTTNTILLIRPANFQFNAETAVSNEYQNQLDLSRDEVKKRAVAEFDAMVQGLQGKGVNVLVYDDTADPIKADAVFPNNWISLHQNGNIITYPMCTPSRRIERRLDIIEDLKKQFDVNAVIDLSVHENRDQFLEGTGSIVFDHPNRIAYACLSPRTHQNILNQLCELIDYKAVVFNSYGSTGQAVYHTNVMMCVGQKFVVICLESITDAAERQMVKDSIKATGHEIIDITQEQMNDYAGNMLEVRSNEGKNLLAMSQSAYDALTETQRSQLEQYCELIPFDITTIETEGGGSVRCMMAEVHLPKK